MNMISTTQLINFLRREVVWKAVKNYEFGLESIFKEYGVDRYYIDGDCLYPLLMMPHQSGDMELDDKVTKVITSYGLDIIIPNIGIDNQILTTIRENVLDEGDRRGLLLNFIMYEGDGEYIVDTICRSKFLPSQGMYVKVLLDGARVRYDIHLDDRFFSSAPTMVHGRRTDIIRGTCCRAYLGTLAKLCKLGEETEFNGDTFNIDDITQNAIRLGNTVHGFNSKTLLSEIKYKLEIPLYKTDVLDKYLEEHSSDNLTIFINYLNSNYNLK